MAEFIVNNPKTLADLIAEIARRLARHGVTLVQTPEGFETSTPDGPVRQHPHLVAAVATWAEITNDENLACLLCDL